MTFRPLLSSVPLLFAAAAFGQVESTEPEFLGHSAMFFDATAQPAPVEAALGEALAEVSDFGMGRFSQAYGLTSDKGWDGSVKGSGVFSLKTKPITKSGALIAADFDYEAKYVPVKVGLQDATWGTDSFRIGTILFPGTDIQLRQAAGPGKYSEIKMNIQGNGRYLVQSKLDLGLELSQDAGATWAPLASPVSFSYVQAVPEPASLVALSLGALALARRRRRP